MVCFAVSSGEQSAEGAYCLLERFDRATCGENPIRNKKGCLLLFSLPILTVVPASFIKTEIQLSTSVVNLVEQKTRLLD